MLWLPIVWLSVMMLVVFAVVASTFLSVAFAAPQTSRVSPPFLSSFPAGDGAQLQRWAANAARKVVAKYRNQTKSPRMPVALAAELETEADVALKKAGEQLHATTASNCPNERPNRIGVTAPEALAIADELKHAASSADVQIVHEIASLNARRARFILPEEYSQAGLACPLRTKNGQCLTFQSRPISCRRLCAGCCDARTGHSGCRGESCKASPPEAFSRQLQEGMVDGLCEGLRLLELDDGFYELNDALATALATPDAAQRWSQGEAVFAHCLKA